MEQNSAIRELKSASHAVNHANLPTELLLLIFDHLVRGSKDYGAIAFRPDNAVTKTFCSLTLVSREISLIGFRYLYTYCVYLDGYSSLRKFAKALLDDKESGVHHKRRRYTYINAALVSSNNSENDMVYLVGRTLQTGRFLTSIGSSLKRLVLQEPDNFVEYDDRIRIQKCTFTQNVFESLWALVELVMNYSSLTFHTAPPPNLKRLAVTMGNLGKGSAEICFVSTLEMLVCMRPPFYSDDSIDHIFSRYMGKGLDVLLLEINSNHRTPKDTRDWREDDHVRIWEVDVPTSFYGDESAHDLCYDFFWSHGIAGTLWNVDKRRMASWSEVQRRLVGPIHDVTNEAQS